MHWRPALAVALLFAPLPAAADVTARYRFGSAELSVEVDDGGDYRVEVAGTFALIRRGGADYVVVFDGQEPRVFERQPFLDLVKATLGNDQPTPATVRREMVLAKGDEEQVGERRGIRWTLQAAKPAANTNKIEAVMSTDPDLAPVAGVLAETVDVALRNFGTLLPGSNLDTALRALFAKGAPLRLVLMQELRLGSVSTAAISPARFELPGAVLDPEVLRTIETRSRKVEVKVETHPAP